MVRQTVADDWRSQGQKRSPTGRSQGWKGGMIKKVHGYIRLSNFRETELRETSLKKTVQL